MRLDPFVVAAAVVVSEESGHWLPNSSDQVAMADDRHEPHSGGLKDMHLARVWRGSLGATQQDGQDPLYNGP